MNVVFLPTKNIKPKENYFKDLKGQRYESLVKSIQQYGILEPVHVKKSNGDYILIQGHQRYRVAKELGIEEIPCIIIDNYDSIGAEFDTNLYRRHLDEEEIEHYENIKKQIVESQNNNLIPELKFLEQVLPPEILKAVKSWPKTLQTMFYKAIPYKVDEKALANLKEIIKQRESAITDLEDEKMALEDKLNEMEKIKEQLKTLKEMRKNQFNEAVKKKVEEIEAELSMKYSGETLKAKLDEERKRITEELTKQHKKEIEELRKIAEKHSKEREELKRQLEPLQEKIEQLQKDLELQKRYAQNAKNAEEWAIEKLNKIIRLAKIPEQVKAITQEMQHVRARIITLKEYILQLGDAIHEEREINLKVIKELKSELRNLMQMAESVIVMFDNPEPDDQKTNEQE